MKQTSSAVSHARNLAPLLVLLLAAAGCTDAYCEDPGSPSAGDDVSVATLDDVRAAADVDVEEIEVDDGVCAVVRTEDTPVEACALDSAEAIDGYLSRAVNPTREDRGLVFASPDPAAIDRVLADLPEPESDVEAPVC